MSRTSNLEDTLNRIISDKASTSKPANVASGPQPHKFPGLIRPPADRRDTSTGGNSHGHTGRDGEGSGLALPPQQTRTLSTPHIPQPQSGFPEYVLPGINMSDVARDTGLTLGAVSRIFNGLRKARTATLKSIANLYTDGNVQEVVAAIRSRVLKHLQNTDRLNNSWRDPNRDKKLEILRLYEKTNYSKV